MITTLSNFTRSILNINSNRIRNKWSSPVCAIPRLIPRFHFPTARSRSSSPPSNVTMLIARRNFDRVEFPPFACLIDPSNASNRVSRERTRFSNSLKYSPFQSCSIFRTNPARRSLLTYFIWSKLSSSFGITNKLYDNVKMEMLGECLWIEGGDTCGL